MVLTAPSRRITAQGHDGDAHTGFDGFLQYGFFLTKQRCNAAILLLAPSTHWLPVSHITALYLVPVFLCVVHLLIERPLVLLPRPDPVLHGAIAHITFLLRYSKITYLSG